MTTKHKGHWLGSPFNELPKRVQDTCTQYFDVTEHGNDVSILSEPNIFYALFFHQKDGNKELLITTLKICNNINKNLILIHDGTLKSEFDDNDFLIGLLDVTNDDTAVVLHSLFEKLKSRVCNQNNNETAREFPSPSVTSISKEMQDILRYIEINLTKEIREEDIAEYCHYSVSYFSKLFHKVIGISFRDYICNKRIAMAKRLLVDERNAKIAFIAYQCGYHDVSYFSRIFKKKTGISPGVFRQIHS